MIASVMRPWMLVTSRPQPNGARRQKTGPSGVSAGGGRFRLWWQV